ncbi:MAG: peptide ABC transporter permease [Burkholderiales bacterium PBB1]|nr:MAG: peptide ABC transporter permease [Burkholderiales bacterium PBB1]
MSALLTLAWRSAWNRRATLSLVLLSVALSTFLLLGFEQVRTDVRENFSQSVSGTDLVVGARTGSVQLMLYAVFRVGSATNNIRMSSVEAIAKHRAVAWVVPLSLGDTHRGYAVLGTTADYFNRFLYGDREPLVLAQGRAFADGIDGLYGAVLGAEVADALGYRLGSKLTLTHGAGGLPGAEHADKPFTVVGILARTGTPVDRTVHISLQSMEAIHIDWVGGAPMPGVSIAPDQARKFDLTPKVVTAALVGLKGRAAVFNVQRFVADYADEPLMAVLPGVALDELWDVVGVGEKALIGMSAMVGVVSLAGLVAVVMAGLNERRRELAVLRAVGAAPRHVLLLLAGEGLLITLCGALLGVLSTGLFIALAAPWVQAHYGVNLKLSAPSAAQWSLFAAVVVAGAVASLIPAWRAYRWSLADGLSPRV